MEIISKDDLFVVFLNLIKRLIAQLSIGSTTDQKKSCGFVREKKFPFDFLRLVFDTGAPPLKPDPGFLWAI